MKARYLSLSPLILWQHAERPIDWAARFGREAPMDVEIGFGDGEWLVRSAQAAPERNVIGIELAWPSIWRALRKIAHTRMGNVRLVQADARIAMRWLFRPQAVQRVAAIFPCPWPKKRSSKHRLFFPPFLRLVNSRLAPGGELQIVTDDLAFGEWILEQVPGTGLTAQRAEIPPRVGTKYARKWQAQGLERFQQIRLQKQMHVDVARAEELVVQAHRLDAFDPERFSPEGVRGPITVEFKDFLFDPARRTGMVRAVIAEDALVQHIWIQIVSRGDGWHIQPAKGCGLVPTVGLQRALDLVRDAARRESSQVRP